MAATRTFFEVTSARVISVGGKEHLVLEIPLEEPAGNVAGEVAQITLSPKIVDFALPKDGGSTAKLLCRAEHSRETGEVLCIERGCTGVCQKLVGTPVPGGPGVVVVCRCRG
jgi:hypothetical protein